MQNQPKQSNFIAQTALDHYFKVLPANKGKPQPGQWTVYAAIVATRPKQKDKDVDIAIHDHNNASIQQEDLDAWVVSCATGSKCTTIHPALNHFGKEHISKCVDADVTQSVVNNEKLMKFSCREKCCSRQVNGFVVHDSHAEVIARRGLIKVLWEEVLHHLKYNHEASSNNSLKANDQTALLQKVALTKETYSSNGSLEKSSGKQIFELKNDVKLHLYISDSPCGDASIYDIAPRYATNQNKKSNTGLTYTGAKIIVTDEGKADKNNNLFELSDSIICTTSNDNQMKQASYVNIARERVQIKSALRLKSGRSDLPIHLRSSSMSCSDKICKWIVLGLQGCGVLARFIPNGVHLSSVVVSHDPRIEKKKSSLESNLCSLDSQKDALDRALIVRAKESIAKLESTCGGNDSHTSLFQNYIGKVQLPSILICDQIFPFGKAQVEKTYMDVKTNQPPEDIVTTQTIADEDRNYSKKRAILSEPNSNSRKRQKGIKITPCGISLNWQSADRCNGRDRIEQLVGAKGILQRKKPTSSDDIIKSVSRLSRHSMNCLAIKALQLSGIDVNERISYQQLKEKHAPVSLRALMNLVQQSCNNPLQGWVKNSSEFDFSLCSQIKI